MPAAKEPQTTPVRQLLAGCRQLLSERGEASGVSRATETLARYHALGANERMAFFRSLRDRFAPDPRKVLAAANAYAAARNSSTLLALTQAAEPPRQELLRRLNRAPGGTRAIVSMREALLRALRDDASLQQVDDDFHHLLSSWFNPGFLHMVRVDWDTPAALLERLVRHEAVHEVRGWEDLRRRLQDDRRCFAFFHPALPGEPLIFVEVALVPDMPAAIAPLLDVQGAQVKSADVKVAVFYGISNCEPGLRGVSLGNFLIKKVAVQLAHEIPGLTRFCTLSPVPGFRAWLEALVQNPERAGALPAPARAALEHWRAEGLSGTVDAPAAPRRGELEVLCAAYLCGAGERDGVTRDPVARFHLNNGARLDRINRAADLSGKGLRNAWGVMVNYVYDLKRVEGHHESFIHGKTETSARVRRLLG